MSKEVLELATVLTNCRDTEIPFKLIKLKDILNTSDDLTKIKHDIYKYEILETISVSFKNEYGYIKDGWNLSVELVKIFTLCTTNFGTVDKQYQDKFLPTACENILMLAKKLQEKHVRSKAVNIFLFKRIIINIFLNIFIEISVLRRIFEFI